jgi:WD40 repeat protein
MKKNLIFWVVFPVFILSILDCFNSVVLAADCEVLNGHSDYVRAVAFSTNGNVLASGSDDETIKLWDVQTGSLIRTLTGHTDYVMAVAFSPDGEMLASGADYYDGSVKLWYYQTGELIGTLPYSTNGVYSLAFSPDGKWLALGCANHDVRLWNTQTGGTALLSGHIRSVNAVAFSPDSKKLASGDDHEDIKIWDVQNLTLIKTLSPSSNGGHVDSLAFSPDSYTGNILAAGYGGSTIKIWNVQYASIIRELSGHSEGVLSVSYSTDGNTLASGSKDNTIKLWDIQTGDLISTLTEHTNDVFSVAFSPTGYLLLASGSRDESVRLCNLFQGNFEVDSVSISLSPSVVQTGYSPTGSGTINGEGTGTVEYHWISRKPGGIYVDSGPLYTEMSNGTASIPDYNNFPTDLPGQHSTFVRVTSPNVIQSSTKGYFVNFPPILSNASVTPQFGDVGDTFVFEVTYQDQNNDSPAIKEIHIRDSITGIELAGSPFQMTHVSGDPQTGETFRFEKSDFSLGNYEYWYYFTDGNGGSAREPGAFGYPFSVQEMPPEITSFSINGGDSTTPVRFVTLNNQCTNNPTHYMASEDPNFNDTSWQNYISSASPNFQLSEGNGIKKVYFKVKNNAGVSLTVSDTIELIERIPTMFLVVSYFDKKVTRGNPVLLQAALKEAEPSFTFIENELIHFEYYKNGQWNPITNDDITTTDLITDENGIGSVYFLVPENMPIGTYQIKAVYDGNTAYYESCEEIIGQLTVGISSEIIMDENYTINGDTVGWILLNTIEHQITGIPPTGSSERIPLILVHGNNSERDGNGILPDTLRDDARWGTFWDYINNSDQYSQFDVYTWIHDTSKAIGFNGNTGNASELADCIYNYILPHYQPGTKVVFVAYSRGGLVVRSFMNYNNQGDDVHGLITLGTPHHGSPFAVPDWDAFTFAWKLGTLKYLYTSTFNLLVGRNGLGFDIDRLGSLNLAWDNLDNAIMGIKSSAFDVAFANNGTVSLTSRDINNIESYNDTTILYSDLYKSTFGTLANLNQTFQYSYYSKIVTFGAFDENFSDNTELNDFFDVLAQGFNDEHERLNAITKLLSVYSHDVVSNNVNYYANDGLVPLQSALCLDISNGDAFSSISGDIVSLNTSTIRAKKGDLKRYYILNGYTSEDDMGNTYTLGKSMRDHLDLIETSATENSQYWSLITKEIKGFVKPKTPSPIHPADDATIYNITPTFEWSAFDDAGIGTSQSGYQLKVLCDTNSNIIVYDTGFIADTSGRTHTIPQGYLEWNKHYHWHVRYQDSNGNWSDWSADDPNPHQDFYTQQQIIEGQLKVNIQPQGAIDAGAQWKLTSESIWHVSGTIINLEPGNYEIEFKNINGWNKPNNVNTTVSQGQLTEITPIYTQMTPGTLHVTPSDNLNAAGQEGGPFTPNSIVYEVSNTGETEISFTVTKSVNWITLSNTVQILSPGQSIIVSVSIDSDADNLSQGNYSDDIIISNTTNGNGNTTRFAFLTITEIPSQDIKISHESVEIPNGGSFDFGNVQMGSFVEETFTIENTGTADLLIDGIQTVLSGADADQFNIVQLPTGPIAPNGNSTIIISFAPWTQGAKTASISIVNNDPDENPYDILLTGTGVTTIPVYRFWYDGKPSHSSISGGGFGFANSTDGINITRHPDNPILTTGGGGAFNEFESSSPYVVYDGSLYHMLFIGRRDEGDTRVYKIGYATSSDGVQWDFYAQNPIQLESGNIDSIGPILYLNGYYKMWYAKDGDIYHARTENPGDSPLSMKQCGDTPVITKGDVGEWDEVYAVAGSIIYENGMYKMWYTGRTGTTNKIGYATSPDGIYWTKYAGNPVYDDTNIDYEGAPAVIHDSEGYKMYYTAPYAVGVTYPIRLAISGDGINWSKYSDTPVLAAGSDSWDHERLAVRTAVYGEFKINNVPFISHISSLSVTCGTEVVIKGAGFGDNPGSVSFGGETLSIQSWWDTEIVVTTPNSANSGLVTVETSVGINSNSCTLTVECECIPPSITLQPQNQVIDYNTFATLTVEATGSDSLSYQWYQGESGDASTPVGESSPTFTTPSLTVTTSYWVQVSNDCGSVDSNAATVTVNPPAIPEIKISHDGVEIPDGGIVDFGTSTEVTLTIENTGTANLELTALPITISGADADQFNIVQQPSSPIVPGGSTTLVINFSPTSGGEKTTPISIANNDADENPYDLTMIATGVENGTLIVEPTTWVAPAGGGTSPPINVSVDGVVGPVSYTVSEEADWLEVSSQGDPTPGTFTITVSANTAGENRDAFVTVTAEGVSNSPVTVQVIQRRISLDIKSGTFNGEALAVSQPQIIVEKGQPIQGTVSIAASNYYPCQTCIMPFAWTPTWGNHQASFHQVSGWVSWQQTVEYDVNIDIEAPPESGTYYLWFVMGARYNSAEMMSCDRPQVWDDGDDIADMGEIQYQPAVSNGGVDWTFNDQPNFHDAVRAIKVIVTESLPEIVSLLPDSGSVGTEVTISGSAFGSTQGTVTFNGVNASINSWTDTQIVAVVPAGAVTGEVVVHSANGSDSNGAAFTVTIPAYPEINIINIPDGGSIDFGSVQTGSSSDTTLTIKNTGTADLDLNNLPIVITGTNADQFNVTQQPTSPIAPNGTTTLIIHFAPTTEGEKTASISIVNNDPDENPYDITFTGIGTSPNEIPGAERSALIALYNSTNGDNWTDNSGWKDGTLSADGFQEPGTEHTWYGVSIENNQVVEIGLYNNNLVGTIPPELENLTKLKWLGLSSNQLTGNFPGWLRNLPDLERLELFSNELEGTIPSWLGELTKLKSLKLSSNQFVGSLPVELNNLTNLDQGELDLRWNSLYTNDETLMQFLNTRQSGGDWESTQTISPSDVSVTALSCSSIEVSWIPIIYTENAGGYRVFYSTTSSGPYTYFDVTADKTVPSMTVAGLAPAATYYFVIQTCTEPHSNNQNTVCSEFSEEISVVTPPCVPTITVISPNGGENCKAGAIHTITWTSTGTVNHVIIEYSTDNGTSWVTIVPSTANDGSYNWTVPDKPSDNCLIRISGNDTDSDPSDVSDASFSIISPDPETVTVTSPNGGESLTVGSTYQVTWASTGSVGDVKIEYSIDNGTSWTTIAPSTANDGSFNWTVPDMPSDNCLARIGKSVSDEGPSDVSDSVFSIVPSPSPTITVTSPNGKEHLTVGLNHKITWTSTGNVDNVKIEYSTDNGTSWTILIASTTNNGIYDWTVPDNPSENCLVKISETDGDPLDVSDAVFAIVSPPSITLTSPNGSESWEVGSSHYINWNSTGNVGKVKIKYSIDNGTSWTTIESSTPNDGSFNWIVPDTLSDNCLVQISADNKDGKPSDVSDSVFSIVPSSVPTVTITSPNGGEYLTVGSIHSITWTSTGNVGNVKVQYSIDNGTSWIEIVASATDNGSYDWTVPDYPSESCLVQISEADGEPSDVSDAVFSIVLPTSITITSPNGGESWEIGTSHNITWTSTGIPGDLKIEYSIDDGTSWTTIVPSVPNDGIYKWTAPETLSDNCLIRISENDADEVVSDISDAVFSIVLPPIITVTSPNGGETLEVGSTHGITWTSTGSIREVEIEYSIDNGTSWTIIVESTVNDGNYDWTIPDTPSNISDNCLIRISGNDSDETPSDVSDSVFSIVPASSPTVTVTSPNGGEILFVGSTFDITWTSAGNVGDVKIEYSTDSGSSWTEIITAQSNEGSYEWTVPDEPSDNCLIRVKEIDGEPSDISDADFSIVAPSEETITIASPNGGETWEAGSTHEITWTSTGTIDTIIIEYSTDNGTSWTIIIESTSNSGSYNWTIPDTPSDDCLVRVSGGTSDEKRSDISDAVFSITPNAVLTLSAPNGEEILQPGENFLIKWESDQRIEHVKLEYSPDNGSTYLNIIDRITNSGYYNWRVPPHISSNCLVRVSSADGLKPSQHALVYEFKFKITASQSPSTVGETFTMWLGDVENTAERHFTPKISFNQESSGNNYIQFNETIKEIPQIKPLPDRWHLVKVLIDQETQLASIWLDNEIILENLPLNPARIFSPAVSFSVDPENSAGVGINDFRVLVFDSKERQNRFITLFAEDFDNFEEGKFPKNSGWKSTELGIQKKNQTVYSEETGHSVLVSLDYISGIKFLKLQTIENKQIFVVKHFNIPVNYPFDTSDKKFSIVYNDDIEPEEPGIH